MRNNKAGLRGLSPTYIFRTCRSKESKFTRWNTQNFLAKHQLSHITPSSIDEVLKNYEEEVENWQKDRSSFIEDLDRQ